jgi:hypothetical protein
MEDNHEKTFTAMRKKLTEAEKTLTVFDPEGEGGIVPQSVGRHPHFFRKRDRYHLHAGNFESRYSG